MNNGARLCASARLCRGSPVSLCCGLSWFDLSEDFLHGGRLDIKMSSNQYKDSIVKLTRCHDRLISYH